MGEAAVTSKADQDGCFVGFLCNGLVGSETMKVPSELCSFTITEINGVSTNVVLASTGSKPTKHSKPWSSVRMLHIGIKLGGYAALIQAGNGIPLPAPAVPQIAASTTNSPISSVARLMTSLLVSIARPGRP